MSIVKTPTNLDTLKINYLTQEMYEEALANDEINENELYLTPSDGSVSGIKGNSEATYRQGNVNLTLANIGVHISTSAPTSSDGNDGDIWLVYTDNEE